MLTATLAAIFIFSAVRQAPPSSTGNPLQPLVEVGPSDAGRSPGEDVIQLLKEGDVRFELLDERGKRHKVSLLRIRGDDVTLWTGHEAVTVPARQFQRTERRGDPPWDGALIGFGVGAAMWGMIAADAKDGGLARTADNADDWTAHDTVSMLCFTTAVGFIIDLLHVGSHTVLVGPMHSESSSKVEIAVAREPHGRRLQVGYRVAF